MLNEVLAYIVLLIVAVAAMTIAGANCTEDPGDWF